MKKEREKLGVLLIFAILLTIASAGITYMIVYNRQAVDEKMDRRALKTHVVETKELQKFDVADMEEFLKDGEDIYLESFHGPVEMIELDEQEREEIVTYLKGMKLEKADTSQGAEVYTYALHLKNKNIKLKVNIPYLYVENMKGKSMIFAGEPHEQETFVGKLQKIYMKKYHQSDLFKNAKAITVIANDEKHQWDLDKKEIDELIGKIALIAPVDETEVIGIPAKYPDYSIMVKTNHQEYRIHLMHEELLTIDSLDQNAYYKYDGKLWSYILEKYPVKFQAAKTDLKYLLKASKIIVDDAKNQYDLEDESYYPRTVARTILHAKPKEVTGMDDRILPAFILTFMIDGRSKVVQVYRDYLTFEGRYYYCPRIDEAIRSTISVL
ncbi:hypothetical protein [Thermotalea metallivorans]|uniref:DUF4340 domain-containing protein n=1 Tax=Thermotalea metallivorans TaxID=520762 RepID=A0A140L7Q1_9FIRM|nr:hypothetical protein [Thermotalea metallivorans]KXG76576.1 hypothetical protein AN619_09010 [Thermotalea metallivorans]